MLSGRRWAALAALVAGMNGVRVDRGWLLVPWAALALLSVWLCDLARGVAPWPYLAACWTFYYVGNGVLLGTPVRGWLIARLGEARAYRWYELVCGLMFVNIGLAHGVAYELGAGSMAVPGWLLWPLVVALTVVGFGVKAWATDVVGLDTYYYRDCFLGRPIGAFSCSGPYRWLKNPMYGVGNLHAYAGAVLVGSWTGLWFAAACHASIFAFYRIVEFPFIRRTYLSAVS